MIPFLHGKLDGLWVPRAKEADSQDTLRETGESHGTEPPEVLQLDAQNVWCKFIGDQQMSRQNISQEKPEVTYACYMVRLVDQIMHCIIYQAKHLFSFF